MSAQVTYLLAGYLVFVALLALLGAARPSPGLDQAARSGATVALVATALLTVVDLVTVLAGHRPDELLAHLGYAAAAIGIGPILLRRAPQAEPPAGAAGAAAEPPPEPPAPTPLPMVALAMVTTAVVVVRLGQTYR